MLIRRPIAGFTLIETMITVAIIAIAMAFGLPGIAEWIQNAQIRTATESLQNGLQVARTVAIRQDTLVEFVLNKPGVGSGTGWTIRTAVGQNVVEAVPDGVGSGNVVIAASPSDATIITFNGYGRRNVSATGANLDGSPPIAQIDVDNPKLASDKSRNLTIKISSGGDIRMCDPNVADTTDPRSCPQ